MKAKIFWTSIAILDLVFIMMFVAIARADDSVKYTEPDCPKGWYLIDENTCKMEPTGCPYGDSIPLDSPKCAPPQNEAVLYNDSVPVDEPLQPSLGK